MNKSGSIILGLMLGSAPLLAAGDVMTDGHTPGQWTMDLDAAKRDAAKLGRPVFVAFSGSDWCVWCKLMDRQVFQTEAWRKYAADKLALVLLDFPKDPSLVPAKYVARNNELRNQFSVKGYPTYVLLDGKSGAEIGRFSAGRDKTPEMLIAEVEGVTGKPDVAADPVPESGTSEQEREIAASLAAYRGAPSAQRRTLAPETLATLAKTLTKDPILLVLVDPELFMGMIPELDVAGLNQLTDILLRARKAGTPIDAFMAAQDRLAAKERSDLATIRGLMYVYSRLGDTRKGLALMPELEVLKQVKDPAQARDLVDVLKQIGRVGTAIDLAFHMQRTCEKDVDKQVFFKAVLSMSGRASDTFLAEWLGEVSRSPALLDTLQESLGTLAKGVPAEQDAGRRAELLRSHVRIVNAMARKAPSKFLARQYLRHWQFEFANALQTERPEPAASASSSSRTIIMSGTMSGSRPRPPAVVPFETLVACGLCAEGLNALPREEAGLHRFQLAAGRLKSGGFDERALQEFVAFADREPSSVASLCASFLEDWGRKVNPPKPTGDELRRAAMLGTRPTGIPLTRARQEQNIAECARIFAILREAQVEVPADAMLGALLASFSRAEVVTRDAVARVFPDVSALSDEFVVKYASWTMREMRENWMIPENRAKLQEEYATNRSEEEGNRAVAEAYRGAIALVRERLALREDSIRLRNVMAALSFDLAEFSKATKLATLQEYTELRDNTFRMFEECYRLYQARLPGLPEESYSVDHLKYWFSAVLGASDLGALDVNLVRSPTQLERIKAALDDMAEPYRTAHHALFGSWICGQWEGIKPHVKLNVLQAAIDVLGDDPSIRELTERMKAYEGLIKEVELRAEVDGSTRVGSGRPFGLLLKLRHTDALEREAGGFSRYVRNDSMPFPGARYRVEYRNRFAANIVKALKDSFEVGGIAWMDDTVHSVATDTAHWRETPLAYVSLKARDATVDRVPSIQMDMDFNDDTGAVVIPVLSNVLIVDATDTTPPARPARAVEVRTILDARRAAEGDIRLEVQIKGEGILPEAMGILKAAPGYTFGPDSDHESVVVKLEQRGGDVVAHSEQTASIPIRMTGPAAGGGFEFPQVTLDGARVERLQYRDADVVPAGPRVSLAAGQAGGWPIGIATAAALGLLAAVGLVVYRLRRPRAAAEAEKAVFAMPGEVDGLSVLLLFERIRRHGALADDQARQDLNADIRRIEQACFSPAGQGDIDLAGLAKSWIARVS